MTDAPAPTITAPGNPPVPDFSKHMADVAAVTAKKRVKVFVALCSRDWQVEHYTSEWVRAMSKQSKHDVVVAYMANDGVARSRNNLVAAALETDCTHVLFVDNDILGRVADFDRLVEADKPVICGLYPKKQPRLDWVANYLPNEAPDARGVIKVKHAGTGFMMIAREVFDALIAKFPEIAYTGDPVPEAKRWDFFPMNAKGGMYKSEDWYFCEMCRDAGIDIHMDTTIQLRHVGKIVYPLQFTLSDDDVIDLVFHRYGISTDHIRTFIGSGSKQPHFMGGHMPRAVRNWPVHFPVGDLHQGAELAGCYDMPTTELETRPAVIMDLGADVGAFAIWAARRWKGSTIHSYEPQEAFHPFLKQTHERLAETLKGQGNTFSTFDAKVALPAGATIVKIDLPGVERDVVQTLQAEGRMEQIDFLIIKYHDDSVPVFLGMLTGPTHWLHCHQRFGANNGIIKFINRRLTK